ncbi:MAG: hypothetical protein ACR2QF_07445, partial [Geminicoccaceae bacterium]
IQAPRPGVPVMLEATWSRPTESWNQGLRDRSAGASESGPILDGPYLLGFRSERGPDISIREIKAFLNEQNVLLISGMTAASRSHSAERGMLSEPRAEPRAEPRGALSRR